MFSDLWFRVRALFRRASVERELAEELQFHVERQAEKYVQDGISREEATRQARIEFGGLERAKEECRDARGVRFLEALLQDVRFGLRVLLKVARLYGDGYSRFGTRYWCEHDGFHRV